MASRRDYEDFKEVVNDLNEEQMFSGNFHDYNNDIAEMMNEMDVSRYYRLLNENFASSSHAKSPRTVHKSQSAQTDLEVPGDPPSWAIVGQNLVEKLHTGLANLINTLYHNPNGYCKEKTKQQTDENNLKYFEFADGCYQSKLLPHIKIPVYSFERKINSEELKRDLNRLMKTASELKGILPWVIKDGQEAMSNVARGENGNLSAAEKSDRVAGGDANGVPYTTACSTSIERMRSPVKSSSSLNTLQPHGSSGNLSEVSNSPSSSFQMDTRKCKVKTSTFKQRLPHTTENSKNERFGHSKSTNIDNPGITVSEYYLPKRDHGRVQFCVSKPSVVNNFVEQDVEPTKVIKRANGLIVIQGLESDYQTKPLGSVTKNDEYHSTKGKNNLKNNTRKSAKSIPGAPRVSGNENKAANDKLHKRMMSRPF